MSRKIVISSRKVANNIQPTISKQTKTVSLTSHAAKIQQKLIKLRQEVQQKKKINNKSKHHIVQSSIVNIDQQLKQFLNQIHLSHYNQIFKQNGIDSLDVLRDVKQKQLEEIGITKGHALKIIVTLKKIIESKEKRNEQKRKIDNTNQNSASKPLTNKYIQNHNNIEKSTTKSLKNLPSNTVTQSVQVGSTEEQLPLHKYFCLYCYKMTMKSFCSEKCQNLYNKMFEKYQQNLIKAQQLFGPKKINNEEKLQEGEQFDSNDFLTDLEFLDLQNREEKFKQLPNFDENIYKDALHFIKEGGEQINKNSIQKSIEGVKHGELQKQQRNKQI